MKTAAAIAFCGLLLCTLPELASAVEFKLENKSVTDGEINAPVDASGLARLALSGTALEGVGELTLDLTPFRNASGQTQALSFNEGTAAGNETSTLTLPALERQYIWLDASTLRPGETYFGVLRVRPKSGAAAAFALRVVRPAPVVIQVAGAGIDLNVPADGRALISYDVNSSAYNDADVEFSLGAFTSETDGSVSPVTFADGGATTIRKKLTRRVAELALDAPKMRFNEKFVGELTAKIGSDSMPPVVVKLTRRVLPTDAVISIGTVTPFEVVCWSWKCAPAPLEVSLQEPTQRGLVGLGLSTVAGDQNRGGVNAITDLSIDLVSGAAFGPSACRDDALKPDPSSNSVARARVDLWHRAGLADPNIAKLDAGSTATLCVRFLRRLAPGEYRIPVEVAALNAAAPKQLLLSFTIKRTPLYPLLVLVLSVLVSYVLTKVIRTQLQRLDFSERTDRVLGARWFRDASTMISVIRIEATLRQISTAIDYSRWLKYLFFPNPLVDDLAFAEKRLPPLKRLCDLVDYWRRSNHDQLVVNRARKELADLSRIFAETPLEQEIDSSVIVQLSKLEEWRDAAKLLGSYWASLLGDILQLRARVRLGTLPSADFEDCSQRLSAYRLQPTEKLGPNVRAAIERFRGSLDAQTLARCVQELDAAAASAQALHDGSAAPFAQMLQSLKDALDKRDESGPDPIMTVVLGISNLLDLDGIANDLQGLALLRAALEADEFRASAAAAALKRAVETMVAHFDPVALRELVALVTAHCGEQRLADREVVRLLTSALRTDQQPKDLGEAVEREIVYSRLKLIATAKPDPTAKPDLRDKLMEAQRRQASLEDLFDIADDWAWEKLKKGFSIKTSSESPAAFELIEFVVAADDDDAKESFLFKHGLEYQWTITFKPIERTRLSKLIRRKQPPSWTPPALEATTNVPRVTQFIPTSTELPQALVKVKRTGEPGPPLEGRLKQPRTVAAPRIFGAISAFRTTELAALALAMVAAVTTGMQSQQYQAALAGSVAAFWTLFAWGFGADQIKNVLTSISTLTSPPARQ